MRFVEGNPVLNSVAKSLEACIGIMLKIFSVSEYRNEYEAHSFLSKDLYIRL